MDSKNPESPPISYYARYFRKYKFGFAAQISYILNTIVENIGAS